MKALVSGQAGLAVLLEGEHVSSLHLDSAQEVPRSRGDILHLLSEATDVFELDQATLESANQALELAWRKDRSLQLTLVLLDAEADPEARQSSVACLEEFFADTSVLEFASNRLYAAPLPPASDLVGALLLTQANGGPVVGHFLEELGGHQRDIQRARESWDALSSERFGSREIKAYFGKDLVDFGVFRRLVQAVPAQRDMILLECLANPRLRQFPDSRNTLMSWADPLRVGIASHPSPVREGDDRSEPREAKRNLNVLEIVTKRKDSIKQLLTSGKINKAIKFADELVEYQRTRGKIEHIAMTLCDLAQYAKELGAYHVQLRLAQRAVDEAFTDGWSQAQLGDAYKCARMFQQALEAYDCAAKFGQEQVARAGRAEVLKAQGKLDEALREYDRAVAEFPVDVVARTGRAEVLKAQGKLDEALREYDSVVAEFPADVFARNGKSATLSIMGRYDEALALLPTDSPKTKAEWISCHIRGMIMMKQVDLDGAIKLFQRGVQECPWFAQRSYFRNALAVARMKHKEFTVVHPSNLDSQGLVF